MPVKTFPRSTPEAEGIPSAAILGFIDAVEQHAHPLDAVQSFMLLRHGKVVAEGWWEPYRPEFPHMLYSLSKSFTSSAIGLAVAEGLLSVDDPVLSFFPGDAPENPSDHLMAMTVQHLLTMNTGHHEDTLSTIWGGSEDNWPRAFLALPVRHEPGTWF
ncbi:MAG: beta-lactamase family protein, partial [Thermomicrobiales bacterium]|nr:beta-lactamase family protein [Thermomicrobiales bacterium]